MNPRRKLIGLISVFALAFGVVVVMSVLSYRSIEHLAEATQYVSKAQRVAIELERTFSEVKDAEASARGYLITRKDTFLATHYPATERAHQSLARLHEIERLDPQLVPWHTDLDRLVSARLAILAETLRKEPGKYALVEPLVIQGKQRMDALRLFVDGRRSELRARVDERSADARQTASRALTADVTGTALGLLLIIATFAALLVEARRRSRAEAEARNLSLVDDLTGLYNRRGFVTLGHERLRLARRLGLHVVVCYADIDGLKRINDEHGHDAGDRAIATAARVLRATFRGVDILGRMGGDEFAVLAVADSVLVVAALEARLAGGLDAANQHEGLPFQLSMTLGTVTVDSESDQAFDDIMEVADRAMYARRTLLRGEADKTPKKSDARRLGGAT